LITWDANAARRDKKTKNVAMPPSTNNTTTNKLKMPQFIPRARLESDLPKQAAQASNGRGAAIDAASAAPKQPRRTFFRFTDN
jgi:hypothetical protein